MSEQLSTFRDLPLYPNLEFTEGIDSIRNAIDMMVLYSPGEDFTNPKFGCDLEDLLFELIDELTAERILATLMNCITFWDPRIRIMRKKSKIVPFPDRHLYELELFVEVVATEQTYIFEMTLPATEKSG